ncbi:hypothetical protein JCM3770_004715 [Rhodotorula araucariae]
MFGPLRLAVVASALAAAVAPSLAADAGSGISFDGIDAIFSFGDSYSTVGYKPQFGLKPVPLLGGTTSGGYNWVQFLAFSHAATNQSYFDFAQSGATVDNSIIRTNDGNVPPSFDMQVAEWEQFFGVQEAEVKWTAEGSLFTVFFGINDMGYTGLQGGHNASELIPRIVASYEASVSRLYERGARKFLLVLVPPTYRSPYIRSFGESMVGQFVSNINQYTLSLQAAISSVSARFPDAVFKTYDPTPLFNSVLDNAASFGFSVSDSSCLAYRTDRAPDPDIDLPACGAPLKEYVWADDYHPTWAVHKLLAQDMLNQFLSSDETASASPTLPVSATESTTSSEAAPLAAGERLGSIARRGREPFRRPAHGSGRGPARGGNRHGHGHGHAAARRTGEFTPTEEKMRRRWAGLA